MARFSVGDRVPFDISDRDDPDHAAYHGEEGTVVDDPPDDLWPRTGGPSDSVHYTVQLDDGRSMRFQWRDLRPATEP